MKRLNKFFALLLTVCLMLGVQASVVAADTEEVLVFESFGDYKTGIPAGFEQIVAGTDAAPSSDAAKGRVFQIGKNGMIGVFPFDKMVTADSGSMHYSMDLKVGSSSNQVWMSVYNNSASTGLGNFSTAADKTYSDIIRFYGDGSVSGYDVIQHYGNVSTSNAFDGSGTWAKVDFFWDIETRAVELYINGNKMVRPTEMHSNRGTEAKGVGFRGAGGNAANYYDNVYAATYTGAADTLKVVADTDGLDSITSTGVLYLGFSEYLKTVPEKENFMIVNALDNTEVTDYSLTANQMGAKIEFTNIPDGKYYVYLKNLQGVKATSVSNDAAEFYVSTSGKAIYDKAEFYNYEGTVCDYTQPVTTGLTHMELTFSRAIESEELENIYIEDGDGNKIQTSASPDGKKVILTLKQLLSSGEDYTLVIDNAANPYSISFSMKDDASYSFFGQKLTAEDGVATFEASVVKTDDKTHNSSLILVGLTESGKSVMLKGVDVAASDIAADAKEIKNYTLTLDSLSGVTRVKALIVSEPSFKVEYIDEIAITQ